MSDYNIKNIYQGGYSTFNPGTSYSNAGSFGMTTDPRTANLIKEASSKLSSGVKHIELTLVTPQIMDSVPKQQMKELQRLGSLTGVEFSVHGPVIDTTGVSQNGFSEMNRQASERTIIETLERSHEINPKGNIPVVFHSGEGIPGSDWKTLGKDRKAQRLVAIDKESGKITALEEEKNFQPGMHELKQGNIQRVPLMNEKGELSGSLIGAEERLISANHSQWQSELAELRINKQKVDEILQQNSQQIIHLLSGLESGEIKSENLTPTQIQAYNNYSNAKFYLENLDKTIHSKFSKAFEFGDKHQRNELQKINEIYSKMIEEGYKKGLNIFDQSQKAQFILDSLSSPDIAPEMFVPIEKFAVDQSAKTFGNAAFQAYKKYKSNAPIINIENPPAGFALSTAEDLRKLVEASRKQFVENAVKAGEMSESQAKKEAEKLIGATWDVGHINMLRGKGFKEEDIIKQTEIIAPYVKHIHLSDNFGMEHTELPMGMGNVPIKKIMEKLGEKGFEAKKIIEASSWWQHFQTPPFQETLESFGSAIYNTGQGPYWSQAAGLQQGYMGGYGNFLPQTHYETFGSGFTQLPTELGGQRGGAAGSRMSGRGME